MLNQNFLTGSFNRSTHSEISLTVWIIITLNKSSLVSESLTVSTNLKLHYDKQNQGQGYWTVADKKYANQGQGYNQRGRQVSILIPKESDSTCPVDAVRRFIAMCPCIDGPFFCLSNGRPASRFQFKAVLHKCLLLTQFASQYFRSQFQNRQSQRLGTKWDATSHNNADGPMAVFCCEFLHSITLRTM